MDIKSMLINLGELRETVDYQTGAGTKAPRLIFAAQDYEECDGTSGLSADGKYVSEPAIVYIRADVLANILGDLGEETNDTGTKADLGRLHGPHK